jgi:hypothetical protein
MGETGVWYGIAASNVLILVVAFAWFLRGTWTESVVDTGPGPSAVDAGNDAESETQSSPGSGDEVPADDD